MKPPTSKLPQQETTIFTTMGVLAREHKAVNLSQGFPNFPPDPKLISLVHKAMLEGHNQYAPMQGVPILREGIAENLENEYGRRYDPQHEITITAGATQAIFTAITAFVHPNDEVIVIEPAFDCYAPAIHLAKGVLIPLPLDPLSNTMDWAHLKRKLSPKTKMIIINTPHNPTGSILTKEDLQRLSELLEGTDTLILSDEVYAHMVFDGLRHESVCRYPALADRSLVCQSFGKTFHVTGWKVGYMAGPRALMEEFNKVHQFNVFCVNRPLQHALASYLKQPEHYKALADFYQNKRDYLLQGLAASRFKWTPASGSYFQVVDYSAITDEGDVAFAQRLVREKGLATIPLSVFKTDRADHHQLRLCFAKTEATLDAAIAILNTL